MREAEEDRAERSAVGRVEEWEEESAAKAEAPVAEWVAASEVAREEESAAAREEARAVASAAEPVAVVVSPSA